MNVYRDCPKARGALEGLVPVQVDVTVTEAVADPPSGVVARTWKVCVPETCWPTAVICPVGLMAKRLLVPTNE